MTDRMAEMFRAADELWRRHEADHNRERAAGLGYICCHCECPACCDNREHLKALEIERRAERIALIRHERMGLRS